MQVTCLISVRFLQVCLHVAECHGHTALSAWGELQAQRRDFFPYTQPVCFPGSCWKPTASDSKKTIRINTHKCCHCSLFSCKLDIQVCVSFLQIGRFCIQFPSMLSFLSIQSVLVAHVNNPAQLHEPAFPSNRGWIGSWFYI